MDKLDLRLRKSRGYPAKETYSPIVEFIDKTLSK